MKWRKADRRVQLPQLKRLRAQSKHGSRGRERLPGAPFEPPSEQIYTTVRGVVLLNGYFIFGRAFKSTISNYPSLIRFCRSLYPFFLKQPFSAFSPFFLAFSPFLLPGNVSSLFFSLPFSITTAFAKRPFIVGNPINMVVSYALLTFWTTRS